MHLQARKCAECTVKGFLNLQAYSWLDFAGNIGVTLIVISYLLLQLGRLDAQSKLYSGVNALGACLILISLSANFNFSAALVESFWLLISGIGLLRDQSRLR